MLKKNLINKNDIELLLKLYNHQDSNYQIDKIEFRAKNDEDIALLDKFESYFIIHRDYIDSVEFYHLEIWALSSLIEYDPKVKNFFEYSEIIYNYLKEYYKKYPKKDINIILIKKDTKLELINIKLFINYFQSLIFSSRPNNIFESDSFTVKIGESILRNKSYKDMINEIKNRFYESINKVYETKTDFFSTNLAPKTMNKLKIFIVHGQDDSLKDEVSIFLKKLDLQPIILHEQVNKGRTIIEKFEFYTDVSFAIILYTPCDIGGKSKDELSSRARQNVVFEHGYLMSKLNRENICVLRKGDVEIPNDLAGTVYVRANEDKWKFDLMKELKSANFDIDANKFFE